MSELFPQRGRAALSLLLSLIGVCHLQAQCPTFTTSSLTSPGCFNGNTPCDLCPGESFQLNASGTTLPNNGCVNWYYSPQQGFNPYAGEGTLIGCGSITAPPPPPCTNCPEILAIWIDACGSEQANEFMILSSGSGFNVNNLGVDFDPSNNTMSPLNEDINTNGGSCSWQVPSAGLISAMQASGSCDNTNIIPAGPGTTIPPGVLVVVWTSSAASTQYNFDNLCAAGQTIYVMQNTCARTIGAFSNSSSTGERTTTIVLNNCNCSHSITHDTDDPSLIGDGDYAYYDNGTVTYGNGGCANPTPPDVGPGPVDYPPATVQEVSFTVTAAMCNQGPYYVVGVLSPLAPGCPEVFTDEFVFDVPCPEAVAGFSGNPCQGGSITLEASGGGSYQWSGPAGFSSSEQNPTLDPLGPGSAGTYSVTVTNAAGCTDVATVSISVFPEVTVSVSPANPSFCEGASVLLTASGQGGGGGYQFAWTTPGGPDNGPSILVTQGGPYSVTLTDANGCTATAEGMITLLEGPTVSINPDPAAFCSGGSVELSGTITGGAGGNVLVWTDPAGNTFNSPTLLVQVAGTYTLTVTDMAGCTGSASIQVSEYPIPAVSLSSDPPTLCVGAESVVTAAGQGGTGNYTFNWQTPSGPASGNPLVADQPGTYIVLLTDAAGCTATDTLVLDPGVNLQVSFNPNPATFCPGGSVTLSAQVQGAQGGTMNYLWDTPFGQASGNPLTIAVSGIFSVTVTEENGCSGAASITVSENASLALSFEADTVLLCAGAQAVLRGTANGGDGNYTYTWIHPGGPSAGDTLLIAGPGTYLLEAVDGNGCMGLDSVQVLPDPGIDLQILAGQPAVCPGGSTTLTLSPAPSSGWTVQWQGPSGPSTAYPLPANGPGMYIAQVAYGAGCNATDTLVLDQLPVPQIAILPANPSVCAGGSLPLSVELQSGGPLLTYNWSTPGGPASGPGLQAALAGVYSVTVTNGSGCTGTASASLTLAPGLNVSFPSSTLTICSGAQTALSPVVGSGNQPFSYSWSGPLGGSSADTLFTGAPGNYTVTVTDAGGCTGSAQVTVLIGTSLDVDLLPLNPGFCPGSDVLLQAQAPGGQAPLQYAWNGPAGPATSPTLNASQAGTYQVTVTDASGCSGQSSVIVQAWPAPQVVLSAADTALCFSQTTQVQANASGGSAPYTFSWTGPGTVPAGSVWSGAFPGNYQVTVTDSRGCSALAQTSIGSRPDLILSMDPAQPAICQNQSITVTGSVISGTGPFSWIWTTPSGALPGNPVNLTEAGIYQVQATDPSGCTGSLDFSIAEDDLAVTIQTSVTVTCGSSPYTATATASGGQPPYTYSWQGPSGPASGTPVTLSGAGQVVVMVTDQHGCSASTSTVVNTGPGVTVNLETRNETCPGAEDGSVLLLALTEGALPLEATVQGGPTRTVTTLPFEFGGFSAGTYALILTDAGGCQSEYVVAIGLDYVPEVRFQPEEFTLLLGDGITLEPQLNFPAAFFRWEPGAGLSCADCRNPQASPEQTTRYTLVATDEQGCEASASVNLIILVNTRLYLPNAISPNEDGINDRFFVQAGDEQIRIESMRIFDRWGDALFEAFDLPVNDFDAGWDGKYRDKPLDPGVYVYAIEIRFPDGRTRIYRGDITLVR